MKRRVSQAQVVAFIIITALFTFVLFYVDNTSRAIAQVNKSTTDPATFWPIQAIDTMKYSRDTARGEATSKEFEREIAEQVKNIADTGATHIAIATPYDEEFIPFMKKWVNEARKNNLNVWYRGNFSGWEGWFDYDEISRADHIQKTEEFILAHPELFEDGDIFTPCPECENGGPGDPRLMQGDDVLYKYRKFLKDSHKASADTFKKINKDVRTGYFSMNGDVAELIMDDKTTNVLDNVVVVDHYVDSPTDLNNDINDYAQKSNGKVILGEFGAPIPDIHGDMSEQEQAAWLEETLRLLANNHNVLGLNYWTAVGGSTEIWKDGKPTLAVGVLKKFFKPKYVHIQIQNELGENLDNATLKYKTATYKPGKGAKVTILYVDQAPTVVVSSNNYEEKIVKLSEDKETKIILKKSQEDIWFKLKKFIRQTVKP